jgi:serine/threonine-protein kinase RsbT
MNKDLSKEAPHIISIRSELDIVAARMAARTVAQEMGFTKVDQARIATATSELTRNIIMHAGQGAVTIRHVHTNQRQGIEIIFEDQGPGMTHINGINPEHAPSVLTRTTGYGLSGSQRMMDTMEINSTTGGGTKIICRKWMR